MQRRQFNRNAVLATLSMMSSGCAVFTNLDERKKFTQNFGKAFSKGTQGIKSDFADITESLLGLQLNVKKEWGEADVKLPNEKVFVKYTEGYHTRSVTDFDKGLVSIETTDDKDPSDSLKRAIVVTLLTANDPRAVDLFTDAAVNLGTGGEPYLLGIVVDREGKPIKTQEQAAKFAAYLVEKQVKSHTITSEQGQKVARTVDIPMVPNFTNKNAAKYQPIVARFASHYKVSPSLVFGIMNTESHFNPFAVSRIPAFGLMQLVPRSGGRDAYRRAKGIDQEPTPEYLFVPENNIELGTAYLNVLLTSSHLAKVTNPVSREFCVIAAYNTGSGNVMKVFAEGPKAAIAAINLLAPAAVYDKLFTSLPYAETRNYLAKVVTARKRFLKKFNDTTETGLAAGGPSASLTPAALR